MKVQIRQGVFETNSSSTHALSIFSKEQLDLFDKGELYIHGYNLEIVTKEEVDKQWEGYKKRYNSRHNDKEEFRKEYLCALTMDEFDEFCENNYYETLWETSPDNKWVANIMSDYVRNKVVMYPIDEVLSDKLDYELEEPFFIEAFDDGKNINYYICYKLYHTYGEESGDFGRSRVLSEIEQEKYGRLFSDYLNDINTKLFKYVDYCYYNCCECIDYYLGSFDDFYNEI